MHSTAASHHWLPFTQMAPGSVPLRAFVRAAGTRLYDVSGHEVFDAISSVWTTLHGHAHPHIVEAIARQAATLDHVTALGATNPVAEALAERLYAWTGLPHALFAGDGASAVEAALKIALQYWRNVGEPQRMRFARLTGSYHGDTIGAMSVSDVGLFKAPFGAVCFESYPYERAPELLRRSDLAAVIVEPIVQAANGMTLVPVASYDALRQRETLLIVDEIATGFGRTGKRFGNEHLSDLRPDLVVVGKGLSGGMLALSATLATDAVYEAFLGAYGEGRHFFHGHSFAANPIACAAALASLEVFEREATLAHVADLDRALEDILAPLRSSPRVREVRRLGLMCGIELNSDAAAGPYPTAGWNVAAALYDRGHFTRPIGNVIQLVPPLGSTRDELAGFAEALLAVLA